MVLGLGVMGVWSLGFRVWGSRTFYMGAEPEETGNSVYMLRTVGCCKLELATGCDASLCCSS